MTQGPLNLDLIERREKAATKGPWQTDSGDVYDTRGDGAHGVPLVRSDREYRRWGRDLTNDEREANAAFIAGSREWVPDLVAEVRRKDAALKAIDDWWTAEFPKGPDAPEYAEGMIQLSADTLVIWRQIRAALRPLPAPAQGGE